MAWLPRTSIAYLGAAADGDGVAILMPDLSTELIAWERPGHDPVIDDPTLRRVIESVARLHAMPWSRVLEAARERDGEPAPPWCPLAERLTLLHPARRRRRTRPTATRSAQRFLAGWDAFDRRAPAAARELIDGLGEDPSPLVAALGRPAGRRPARRSQAGQRGAAAGGPRRVHRLADDDAGARRRRPRLVPGLQQRLAAGRRRTRSSAEYRAGARMGQRALGRSVATRTISAP